MPAELIFDPNPKQRVPKDATEAAAMLRRASDYLDGVAYELSRDLSAWQAAKDAALHLSVLARAVEEPEYKPRSAAWREYWPTDLVTAEDLAEWLADASASEAAVWTCTECGDDFDGATVPLRRNAHGEPECDGCAPPLNRLAALILGPALLPCGHTTTEHADNPEACPALPADIEADAAAHDGICPDPAGRHRR